MTPSNENKFKRNHRRKPTNLRVGLGARAARFQASDLRVRRHAGALLRCAKAFSRCWLRGENSLRQHRNHQQCKGPSTTPDRPSDAHAPLGMTERKRGCVAARLEAAPFQNNVPGYVRRWNCPTQAKGRLEWATCHLSGGVEDRGYEKPYRNLVNGQELHDLRYVRAGEGTINFGLH